MFAPVLHQEKCMNHLVGVTEAASPFAMVVMVIS